MGIASYTLDSYIVHSPFNYISQSFISFAPPRSLACSHLLLLPVVFLIVTILAVHHPLLSVLGSHFLLHLLRRHLLLVGLHLRQLFLSVLLHLVRVHFLTVAVLHAKLLLVLSAVGAAIVLLLLLIVLLNLVLQLHSVTANKDLIRLRYYLISDDARLAVQAAQVLDVALQLVDHHVVELPEIVNMPVIAHWLVLAQIVLDEINLEYNYVTYMLC